MRATYMLLVFSSLFMASTSDQNFFIWPETYVTINNEILISLICFGNGLCNIKESHCGTEPVAIKTTGEHNMTSETGPYSLTIMGMSYRDCPQGTNEVSFKVEGVPIKLRFDVQGQITSNVISADAIKTGICPTDSSFGYWTVPCHSDIAEICEAATVCDGVLYHERPHSFDGKNESETIVMRHGRECKIILVKHAEFSCSKISADIYSDHQEFHGKFCTIHKAEIVEGKYLIEIPTKIGTHVCVDYSMRNYESDQQCAVSAGSTIEFSLPKSVVQLSATCDGDINHSYDKEIKDINCPMLFKNTRFSKMICQDAYRPVIFWVSMVWLVIGLPCVWSVMVLYYWIRCRLYMKKFWRKDKKCEFCKDKVLSELDEVNHEGCPLNRCPHCCNTMYSNKELKKHVIDCTKRESSFEKTKEILNWELNGFKCKYDANKVYRTKKFKGCWFFIFVIVFFGSFLPSFSLNCDQFNRCAEVYGSIVAIDNSHVPPKNPPMNPDWTKIENDNKNNDGDEIYEAAATILRGLKESEKNIMTRVEVTERKLDSAILDMTSILQTISADIERIKDGAMCEGLMRKVNMNSYIPNQFRSPIFSDIKVFIGDDETLNQYGKVVELSTKNHTPSGGADAGSDSVVQQGRDQQQAQGGSGGNNQFAVGSGTNLGSERRAPWELGLPPHLTTSRPFRRPVSFQERYKSMAQNLGFRTKRAIFNLNQLQKDELKIEIDQNMMAKDKEVEEYKKRVKLSKEDHIFKKKQVTIDGEKHEVNEFVISRKTPLEMKKSKKGLSKWFDFHDIKGQVCEVNCLHEPNTCNCIEANAPKSGRYQLPWTTLKISDIHLSNNPLSFKSATTSVDSSDYDNLYLKTTIDATMELFEGSHVTWVLKHEKASTNPSVSVVIPRITQVYHSSFLYYTCERKFETEVKGYCTGGCGDYCGGKVCLGSRIWKWANCRKLSCNPSWCWATDDGCCCCGSNVYCPNDKKIGSVWSMEYLRTEFLLCLIYNDRFQNCKLIDGTQTAEFGEFTVGVSKITGVDKKISKHILAIHDPVRDVHHDKKSYLWGSPTSIYLDPPVCVGAQQCNHGFIGDIQVGNSKCLPKLGTFCKEKTSELDASNCSNEVFVSHANTDMHMSCNFAHHHSCSHENVVPTMNFEDHLQQTEKLNDHFYIKKLLMSFSKHSMMLFPLPKEGAGTLDLKIEGRGIMVPKKDKKPIVENLMVSECKGCYLCKAGFTCKVSIDLLSPEATLVLVQSKTDLIDFNLSPIHLNKGNNVVMIWGVSYGDADIVTGCIKFGEECLKQFKSKIELNEPTGQFVPNFDTMKAGGSESNECSGWAWFGCLGESVSKLFSDLWKNIWSVLKFLAIIVAIIVAIMLMPRIIIMIKAIFQTCFSKKKLRGTIVHKGKHVNDVYRDLSEKMKKYENKKKTDVEDYELEELMIQREDIDFTSA